MSKKAKKKIRVRMSFDLYNFDSKKEATDFLVEIVIPKMKRLEQEINEMSWPPKRGPRPA